MSKFRHLCVGTLVLGSTLLAACSESSATDSATSAVESKASTIALDVYKSPTCGCCTSWVEHAQTHGFTSSIHHSDNLNAIKDEHGIAANMRSCHTSVSKEGYVFEGHVPAKLVKRFLAAPPEGALGLAVPGMPAGSPGMEMGDRFQAYPVVLLNRDGSFQLYEKIDEQSQQY